MRLKCEFRHLKTDDEKEIVVTLNDAERQSVESLRKHKARKRLTCMRRHTRCATPIARYQRTAGGIRSRRRSSRFRDLQFRSASKERLTWTPKPPRLIR